ncbi:MAG: hypothetical protein R3286_04560 [Gammaproteobacteria bacterium]|nr:hypothetical protein [Gammaproteobacteria bacterium]
MTRLPASYPAAVCGAIEDRLRDGETVIWAGRAMLRHTLTSHEQPAPGEHAPMQATSVIGRVIQESMTVLLSLLLVPIGGVIAAYSYVALGAGRDLPAAVGLSLLLILGLGLAGAGLYGFLEPLRNRLHVVRTYYVLTDRRALILRQGSARGTRILRAGAALLAAMLALALAAAVAGGGVLVLARTNPAAGDDIGTFLFGAGALFVILGASLLIGRAGWLGLAAAWRSLREAMHGDRIELELRSFDVGELDGREIRVKRERRDGVGDLVFTNDNYYDREGSEQVGGGTVEVDVGFLSVDRARELERILRRICTERVAS